MMYELPTSLNVCGVEYAIRSDYRAALDVLSAFSAVDLHKARTFHFKYDLSHFYPLFYLR